MQIVQMQVAQLTQELYYALVDFSDAKRNVLKKITSVYRSTEEFRSAAVRLGINFSFC